MFRIIRLVFGIAFLVTAVVFTVSSVKKMQPKERLYPMGNGNSYIDYDTDDDNKGRYVLSYAIIACGCFVGAGVLLASIKDKNRAMPGS